MNEIELQEAAEIFADRIDDGNRTTRQCAILAYKEAYRNSNHIEWYPTSEAPATYEAYIIGITGTKHKPKMFFCHSEEHFFKECKGNNLRYWTYRDTFLPNELNKTE